jgi:sugar phosphate isomerase/epimerase
MRKLLGRREFVVQSACALAGAGATLLATRPAACEAKTQQIRVTCRDGHLRTTSEQDCWSALAKLGAEGVEAVVADDLSLPGLFHPGQKCSLASAEAVERVAADMQAAKLPITALCLSNRFDDRPEFELKWCTRAAEAAKTLGVKAIRIDVWPHKLPASEFLDFAVRTMKQLLEATESTGVGFGIENHGGTTNKPEFLRELFAGVGSPQLGLTLDIGNFYWFGHPLAKIYELCQEFAPRVFHTHCKNIHFPESEREKQRPIGWGYEKYCCPVDKGDVDYRRVVEILRKAGYANDMCVEDESLGKFPAAEQAGIVARELRYLKGLL